MGVTMDEPQPVEHPGEEGTTPTRATLLVVDDNDLNREMFATFF